MPNFNYPAGSQAITIADYVFETGYNLTDLSEVEAFVRTHRHLPGVVNEKEYLAAGINLSSFLVSLQEKVEESALYSIDQWKRLTRLRKRQAKRDQLEVRLGAALSRMESKVLELESQCAPSG